MESIQEQRIAPELNQIFAERFGQKKLVASLARLVGLAATSDTGGANVAAQIVLGLYNGSDYPMDLTELCRLDEDLFEDAMNVIRLRVVAQTEPHEFFANGGQLFQQIAQDWNFRPKPTQSEDSQS